MKSFLHRMPGKGLPAEDPLRAIRACEPEDRAYQEAFTILVDQHRERVFRLALSVLGPGGAAEAEDVAQEVFLTVFRRLHTFRNESRFATWLYRITYRRAIDVRRRARFRLPHTGDEVLAALPATDAAGRTIAHPFSEAISVEERIRLYAAVEALPELQRSAVYLHYWLGETVEAIGRLLGRRPGTIKSCLHRARAKLARLLGGTVYQERKP